MKLSAMVLAALALTGCGPSLEEMRGAKPGFEVRLATSWDRLGACVTKATVESYETLYTPIPSEQRGEVVVASVVHGLLGPARYNLFTLDLQGEGGQTLATYRGRRNMEAFAKERLDRCALTAR